MGGWQKEGGNVGRGALKSWVQQVSPTVELTSHSRGHARLGLQGCSGDWVVLSPRGLCGTHTHTNKHRLLYHTSEYGAAAAGGAAAQLRGNMTPVNQAYRPFYMQDQCACTRTLNGV